VAPRNEILIFEEELEFAVRARRAVAAVHQISPDRLCEIAAYRTGRSRKRIGCPDYLPAPVDHAFAFHRHRDQRPAGNERHEIVEECFSAVLGIVLTGAFAVELHQPHRRDDVATPFQSRGNFADEPAGNRVGLAKNKRTFNGHRIAHYVASPFDSAPRCRASTKLVLSEVEELSMTPQDGAGPYAETARELEGTAFSAIRYVEETDSTNADAAALMGDEGLGGLTLVAEHQRRGVGRKGRTWVAAPGSALLFTTILPQAIETEKLWLVPYWTALALRAALTEFGIATVLQWPNDVLLCERKIAGILCQSSVSGATARVACGVGINVHRLPGRDAGIDPPPAFCDDVTVVDRAALLYRILRNYEGLLPMLAHPERVIAAWDAAAELPGRRYRIQPDNQSRPFESIAEGLAVGGGLRVVRDDGIKETISLADVSITRKA